MFNVGHCLMQQLAYMVVVQLIDHTAALPLPADKTKMAQQTQLMRNRRGLHADMPGQVANRARSSVEPTKDVEAAWRGECLHRVGNDSRESLV